MHVDCCTLEQNFAVARRSAAMSAVLWESAPNESRTKLYPESPFARAWGASIVAGTIAPCPRSVGVNDPCPKYGKTARPATVACSACPDAEKLIWCPSL